jgi:hypothetical protein
VKRAISRRRGDDESDDPARGEGDETTGEEQRARGHRGGGGDAVRDAEGLVIVQGGFGVHPDEAVAREPAGQSEHAGCDGNDGRHEQD